MLSVLFVNGDPAHQELGTIFLERLGRVTVTPAGSAQDALALLEDRAFDAVVTDYALPDADGVTFIGDIRSRWERLPIIIFSVWTRGEIGEDAFVAGADALISLWGDPPVVYRNLGEEISRQVSRR
jgi:CheY-like chemotaxis protein